MMKIKAATGSTGTQDSFDLTLGFRYTINKHFALHVDYNHTSLGFARIDTGLLAESLFRRIELYLLRICRQDSSARGAPRTGSVNYSPAPSLGNTLEMPSSPNEAAARETIIPAQTENISGIYRVES